MGNKFGGIDIKPRGGYQNIHGDSYGKYIHDDKTESEEKIEIRFRSFLENQDLKENLIFDIKDKNKIIEQILSEQLVIDGRHIIGSYARQTMIDTPGDNDVDIMFILNEKIHGDWLDGKNGPKNCLQSIKRTLETNPNLSNAEIKIDKNVVTVKFDKLKIDVIPAFTDSISGYKIPDTSKEQSWIRTNPRMFKNILEISNRTNGGRINDLIKIVKVWNEKNNKPLSSFHIENLAYEHYSNNPKKIESAVSEEINSFFSRLPWYIRERSYEPVYGDRVDQYLTSRQRELAIEKASRTKIKLSEATALGEEDKLEATIKKYTVIFGEKF